MGDKVKLTAEERAERKRILTDKRMVVIDLDGECNRKYIEGNLKRFDNYIKTLGTYSKRDESQKKKIFHLFEDARRSSLIEGSWPIVLHLNTRVWTINAIRVAEWMEQAGLWRIWRGQPHDPSKVNLASSRAIPVFDPVRDAELLPFDADTLAAASAPVEPEGVEPVRVILPPLDPWAVFDRPQKEILVVAREHYKRRKKSKKTGKFRMVRDKRDVPLDKSHPLVIERDAILRAKNEVNNTYKIIYPQYIKDKQSYSGHLSWCRPLDYAVCYSSKNGTYDLGCRLFAGQYGHNRYHKEERYYLTFERDGIWRGACSADYQSLFFHLMYNKLGLVYKKFDGDPYAILGTHNRKVIKPIANNRLNTTNPGQSATASFNQLKKYYKNPKVQELVKAGKMMAEPTFNEIINIQDLILQEHKDIAEYFQDPDTWGRLQFLESSIMFKNIQIFNDMDNILLTFHDGAVTTNDMAGTLVEVMKNNYMEVIGGVVPAIKTEFINEVSGVAGTQIEYLRQEIKKPAR